MKLPAFGRLPRAAALGALLCSFSFQVDAASTDAWAKVPTLPSACYSGADPSVAKLEAAKTAVQTDKDRQSAVNEKIRAEYDSIDPMEKSARMQQWMMSNPQEAMKYMQNQQTIGNAAQTTALSSSAKKMALDEEKQDLVRSYASALKQAYAPAMARWNALTKKLGMSESDPGLSESGTPDWAYAEQDAIKRLKDQEYQAVCPQWWGATGKIPAYLKRYKDYLTTDRIPNQVKVDEIVAQTYAMMNTPAASWRSTATHDAVIDYLGIAQSLFDQRDVEPRCTAQKCRDTF